MARTARDAPEALPTDLISFTTPAVVTVVGATVPFKEIVKDFMRSKGRKNEAIKPTDEEVSRNPKSRSAILRFIERN